jgi:hypothetical protein
MKIVTAFTEETDLADEAAALEAAGKAGDITAIQERLPDFVARLEALAEGIGAALKATASPEVNATENDVHDLTPLLRGLAEALQAKKAAAIDRIVEELLRQNLEGKTRETIDQISDDVLMTEYGKALEAVIALL